MPVSKKKKYTPSPFAHTAGYKKNSHRDKNGKTQQQRDEEHRHYLSNRRRRSIGDIMSYL
jgi:hypothetical protein